MSLPLVSDLSDHVGFWLRYVSNHVSQAFARKVEGQGVTVAEWVLLRLLYEREPAAPSRLAQEIGMTRGAVTKLADRLIAKALVVRRADPADGRAQTLALTGAGEALVPVLGAIADANDAAFFGALPDADRQTLQLLLERLVEQCGMTAVPTA